MTWAEAEAASVAVRSNAFAVVERHEHTPGEVLLAGDIIIVN